jgi:heptosyltransferase-2
VTHPDKLLRLLAFWRTLHAGHYDAVLLLHHLTLRFGRLKHQLLMRATGARWRVGLDNGHGWFLNVRVKDAGFGAIHEAEYSMAVAQAVGAQVSDKRLVLPLRDEHRARARQLVYGDDSPEALQQRPLIALHPGSGGYSTARRWAPERFAKLADALFQKTGGRLILIGGPEEAELHQQVRSCMRSAMPVCSLAGKGSVHVTAAALELVDLFIGNDAGPMHIAAAVGAPVVAIFGLSNYAAWGPYTGGDPARQAEVVHLNLPCMPCFYRGHLLGTPEGCATRDCLAMLGVEQVEAAALKVLRKEKRYEKAEI